MGCQTSSTAVEPGPGSGNAVADIKAKSGTSSASVSTKVSTKASSAAGSEGGTTHIITFDTPASSSRTDPHLPRHISSSKSVPKLLIPYHHQEEIDEATKLAYALAAASAATSSIASTSIASRSLNITADWGPPAQIADPSDDQTVLIVEAEMERECNYKTLVVPATPPDAEVVLVDEDDEDHPGAQLLLEPGVYHPACTSQRSSEEEAPEPRDSFFDREASILSLEGGRAGRAAGDAEAAVQVIEPPPRQLECRWVGPSHAWSESEGAQERVTQDDTDNPGSIGDGSEEAANVVQSGDGGPQEENLNVDAKDGLRFAARAPPQVKAPPPPVDLGPDDELLMASIVSEHLPE